MRGSLIVLKSQVAPSIRGERKFKAGFLKVWAEASLHLNRLVAFTDLLSKPQLSLSEFGMVSHEEIPVLKASPGNAYAL